MTDFSTTSIVELAAIVANHLREQNIHVVLVGGLAVEIYSENIYLTQDIDMVDISYCKPTRLRAAMAKIGFVKRGRIFVNDTTDISVEFPSPPITVGNEVVTDTTSADSPAGAIPILKPGDVIKDRLAAYFHWRDRPSLVQALAVLIKYPQELQSINSFCKRERSPATVALLQRLLKAATEHNATTMVELEKLVVDMALREL